MILFILIGVAVAVLLAILIVKFLPVNATPALSLILLCAAGYLAYLIYSGIMEPIKFHEEKKVRYVEVIKQLKLIADAQEAHNIVMGEFAEKNDALIKFIDTASFPIVDTRNIVVQENRGTELQPLMVEVEKKVVDTIGYESVRDKIFTGRNYKNMFSIPNSNKEFKLERAVVFRSNSELSSVFQVVIDKADVLEGLSPSLIAQEKISLGGDEIPGGKITIGSLNDVTTAGNWPPLYDIMASE